MKLTSASQGSRPCGRRPWRGRAAPGLLCVLMLVAGCGGGPRPQAWPGLDDHASADPERLREYLDETRIRVEASPEEAYWPFHLAQVHLRLDEPEAAEEALAQALERDPLHGPSLALLSRIHFEGARYAEGAALLEKASALWSERFPRDPFPGDLLAGLALHRDAMGAAAPVEDLVPFLASPGSASTSVAPYLLLRAGEVGSAGGTARQALDADPENAVHRNNYGIALLQEGDAEGAREAFLVAHGIAPELAGPLYNLAIVEEFYFRDHAAAREWFRLYRAESREDPDGLAEILGGPVVGEGNQP